MNTATLTPALRLQAMAVAACRQAIAHEAASYLPAWDELTSAERAQAVTEAAHWLEAVRRVGLLANVEQPVDHDRPAEPVPPVATPCTHCSTPVLWLSPRTVARAIPIDATPSAAGNILISGDRYGVLMPSQAAAARAQGQQLHTRHVHTCPFAHKWAKGALR